MNATKLPSRMSAVSVVVGKELITRPLGGAALALSLPAIVRSTIALHDVNVARAALPALGDLEANLAEFSVMFADEVERRPAKCKPRRH